MNNYNNINYMIKMLYNHVYNNNTICYDYKQLSKKDIILSNIKKSNNFNYLNIVFDEQLKYIGNLAYKCLYKRYSYDSHPTTLRIGVYDKRNTNVDDLERPENVDKIMMYL